MNELLLLGFIVTSFLVTVCATSLVCARVGDRLPVRFARSSSMRAALAVLPVALGAAVALSLVSPPSIFGGCHCATHPHHLHLCFEHATFSWSLAVGCALGAVGLVMALRSIAVVLREAALTARWSARLRLTRTEHMAGGDVQVAAELGTRAVTVGLFRSKAIVGTALWSRLDADGRRAIAAHERAHVERRDPLTLLCLRLAACLMPREAGRRLVDGWRRAAEIACDRAAARWLGDPYVLASTLVACGRMQLGERSPTFGRGTLAAADGDDLEVRVSCLLDGSRDNPRARSTRGDLLEVGLVMATVALGMTALGGSSAHHAVETILGWVS